MANQARVYMCHFFAEVAFPVFIDLIKYTTTCNISHLVN